MQQNMTKTMRFSQVVRSNQHETDTNSIFISIRAKMGGLQEIVTCGIIVGYGSCTYHIIHFLANLEGFPYANLRGKDGKTVTHRLRETIQE